VNLDRKAFARLKRGRSQPEARLDLHGMTLAQAEPALHRFLSSAQARGLRLVLVITGKGQGRDDWGPIPEAPGILKRTIPAWLAADPSVLQVTEAHQRHGGAGAFYVTLRRAK
jgi:DNA-nicking Smr family endonuclease